MVGTAPDYDAIRKYLRAGRVADAEKRCRRLLKRDPGDAEALHLLGLGALLRKDDDASIKHLQRAVTLRDGVPQYHCNLGEALRSAGELEDAVASCRRALALRADYLEAHVNLGACLFALGEFEAADEQFARALALRPDDPQLIVRRADALRELGRVREARAGYERALTLQPDLAAAHTNLGPLLLMMGEPEKALEHCERAVALDPGSGLGQCNLGRCLVVLERLEEAMDAYALAYERMPSSPILCCNIAEVWQEVADLQQAQMWFDRALEHDPDRLKTRCGLAGIWLDQGRVEAALEEYRKILGQAPDLYQAHLGLARAQWDEGDAEGAVASYGRAVEIRPQLAAVHASAGQVLASSGEVERAIESYRVALAQNPNCVPALSGLANTLRGKLPAEDAERMTALLASPSLREGAKATLHNGLAFYHDGKRETAAAAGHAERANALYWAHKSRRGWQYDPAEYAREVDRIIAIFTPAFFERTVGFGVSDARPVFVVGMPRSGTTLTEQILASHPRVFGAGERPFAGRGFAQLPARLGRSEEPVACLDALTPEITRKVAVWHLGQLTALVDKAGLDAASIDRIVDKMPDNYSLLGWIATMFPKATIIHCRRDVRDVALSCWMVQFAQIRWACSLEHIADRIVQYQRLMAHWRATLPIQIHEVDYEQLVADPEADSRQLIGWLGLDWDPRCLEFYRTERLVRTASVTQVRQPIYRRSVERWRPYEPYLKPLLERLDAAEGS